MLSIRAACVYLHHDCLGCHTALLETRDFTHARHKYEDWFRKDVVEGDAVVTVAPRLSLHVRLSAAIVG